MKRDVFSKLSSVISIVLLTLLIGCSNNDDNTPSANETNLIGTWNIVTLESELPMDINNDGVASGQLHLEADCITEQYIFNVDGTWSGSSDYGLQFLSELQDVLCFENARNGEWTLNGNTLSVTGEGVNRVIDIDLTNSTLSFNVLGGLGFETTVVIGTYLKE